MTCSCDLFSCTCTADPPRPRNPKAPPIVYSVDPGVDYYALARYINGELHSVHTVNIDELVHFGYPPDIELLVIEKAQIIERAGGTRQGEARKSDVANLLVSTGRIIEKYKPRGVRVEVRTPTQWKGQLDKKKDHDRTRAELTPDERSIINAIKTKEERGHIMDAVGLGLVYLWRR